MADGRTNSKGIPRQGIGLLIMAIVISLMVHLLSLVEVSRWFGNKSPLLNNEQGLKQKMDVRLIPRPANKKEAAADKKKPIFEDKETANGTPTDASHLGAQNHIAKKELKLKSIVEQQKGLDPGLASTSNSSKKAQNEEHENIKKEQIEKMLEKEAKNKSLTDGRIPVVKPRKPRNTYESLVPDSTELAGTMRAGYQSYIDEKLEAGDHVDINTTDYRFIGYFTALRKAFELVWVYPLDARQRGYQGTVNAEFIINKDGSLRSARVVQSSGYRVLDEEVVSALRLASPFAPLPEGLDKDHLQVTGSFRYILGG